MGHRSVARRTGAGIVNVRVVVAAVLAAAVCMLVLPAAAGAKVDRKYAVPYRTGLAALVTHNRTEVRAFNAYATDMSETASHIASILASDPVDKAALDAERDHAKKLHDQYFDVKLIITGNLAFANAFGIRAERWFSDAGDEIDFGRGMHNFTSGIRAADKALLNVALAFQCLLSILPT